MPKSRNKRKNKDRNIRIKQQQMNVANKEIRNNRDDSDFDDVSVFNSLVNRLYRF